MHGIYTYCMSLPVQPQHPPQLHLFLHSNPTTSVQYCTVHQKAPLIKGSEPKTWLTHTEQTQTVVYWYIITHLTVLLSKALSQPDTFSNHSHPGATYLNISQLTQTCETTHRMDMSSAR